MKAYILSITIVSIIITVAEIMLPDGKIKNTSKIVLSLIFLCFLITPILNIDFSKFDVAKEIAVSSEFLDYMDGMQNASYEEKFKDILKNDNIIVETIKVQTKNSNILKVEIKLSNLVISENFSHINSNVIGSYIAKLLNVKENILYIYD